MPASALGPDYADPGDVVWLAEDGHSGTHDVTTDVFDGRSAVRIDRPTTDDVVNVFRSYGQGVRPTDVHALLDGASYSYSGANVNFQLAFFYTPADLATYGPGGTTPCSQAKDGGVVIPDQCYAIIKYETAVTIDDAYHTVFLEDEQTPFNGAGSPGWWPTQRVGQYDKNSRTATLDQLLGEMADYELFAVGASTGSGTTGTSWLLNLTFGGNSYSFGSAPSAATAATPPAADSDELDDLITTDSIDVPGQTAQYVPTGSANNDLSKIDPSKPMNGEYQNWTDPTDAFVDVYSYSAATYLKTVAVVNGNAVLSGLDVSHLTTGVHHLLLRGQTSGAVAIVQFAVRPAAGGGTSSAALLPPTGWESGWMLGIAGLLLVVGSAFVLVARRRRGVAQHRV